ncbi:MAG: Hsp20/alpha crystallin family protein [Phycisphaerae bacterium]|nr:Hsp20/alpha crystallin family protein [Phycisphaerae bacterium]NUQ47134.1 Hsp20/alpha crystallin family protein [Phycisphaerae bacterium]
MSTETTVEKRPRREAANAERTRTGRVYCPNVDIIERADELLVLADMPGVAAEDIDVRFENGTLEIHGRVRPRQDDETRFLLREYGVGDFHRSFEVSEIIDAGRITAECANGVLTLRLPKAESARPRTIAVKPGG